MPEAAARHTPQSAVVRCRDVRKSFRGLEVLRGIDFDAYDRRVVSIIGPSGSGKSTLLRCLNHLETIDAGEIWFKDELVGYRRRSADVLQEASHAEIARMRARIGMVFQNFNLFGHMSALDNVASGPIHVKGAPRKQARDRALALLERVGLAEKARSYPRELSGGQQQRVAIARALAMEPELLLMDEPTSSLDPELVGEVSEVIRALASAGTTMIVVTHEIPLARDISDEIAFMADGRVQERGPAQTLFSSSQQPWLRKLAQRG
ncbi:MAG: amino acid ABC transporter ATP-binding protein [Burkholderiales bacterium]|nr:amino acid ABC transporter ATP-binding protein [Burkholderiales bacterium]